MIIQFDVTVMYHIRNINVEHASKMFKHKVLYFLTKPQLLEKENINAKEVINLILL